MKYAKRYWDESTGVIWTNYWGTSTFYFEVDEDGFVLRQIQEFERKQYLKYHTGYLDDKFGGLSEMPLDLNEEGYELISKSLFEEKWENKHYQLFPEIVMTEEVVGGSPRIDGHRLTVGDVVNLMNRTSMKETIEDFELTQLEIRQAIHYCAILKCKEDNPIVFCHNCTLRVEQDGDEIEDEENHWENARIVLQNHFPEIVKQLKSASTK